MALDDETEPEQQTEPVPQNTASVPPKTKESTKKYTMSRAPFLEHRQLVRAGTKGSPEQIHTGACTVPMVTHGRHGNALQCVQRVDDLTEGRSVVR